MTVMTAPGPRHRGHRVGPYVFVRRFASEEASGRVLRRLLDAFRHHLDPRDHQYRPLPSPPSSQPPASASRPERLVNVFLTAFSGAGDDFVAPARGPSGGEAGDDFATRALREAWDAQPMVALYHPDARPLHPDDRQHLEAIMDAEPGAEPVTPPPGLLEWLERRRSRAAPARGRYWVAVRRAGERGLPPGWRWVVSRGRYTRSRDRGPGSIVHLATDRPRGASVPPTWAAGQPPPWSATVEARCGRAVRPDSDDPVAVAEANRARYPDSPPFRDLCPTCAKRAAADGLAVPDALRGLPLAGAGAPARSGVD